MQNEEKRIPEVVIEEVQEKGEEKPKRSLKNFINKLMDEFIVAMKSEEEDECYEEQQDEMKGKEESQSLIDKLDILNTIINIITLIVIIVMLFMGIYHKGHALGYKEADKNYETGVHDGASVMGIYSLLLLEEDISEERKNEFGDRLDEILENPDPETINDFIDDLLEEVYGKTVEINL